MERKKVFIIFSLILLFVIPVILFFIKDKKENDLSPLPELTQDLIKETSLCKKLSSQLCDLSMGVKPDQIDYIEKCQYPNKNNRVEIYVTLIKGSCDKYNPPAGITKTFCYNGYNRETFMGTSYVDSLSALDNDPLIDTVILDKTCTGAVVD